MGVIEFLFGSGRNVVAETAEVSRSNAEGDAARDAALRMAAMSQFGAEFALPKKSLFDRVIDGLNRVPRPAMALGTLGLFTAAMIDPVWFGARMTGIALVPEPLWWLLGAVVSFYFGARHQAKGQDLQRQMAATLAGAPQIMAQLRAIEGLRGPEGAAPADAAAETAPETTPEPAPETAANAALADWRQARG
ncbi:Holin of 3TMs, for gene-transfer release [Roseivivax lentus]|uniref:Holin of 3TMs, for gene-transfer release n=1 Tax=Roseivivax lentus TaxID=633194 RepID=A0A1N7N772_9RHOB|nr:holin family protein [Roseivivax lentus]SIS94108.1 Holin of 3TMs, for gene-transfer release [Roseivivax lentus]